jgi:hypothetical protein
VTVLALVTALALARASDPGALVRGGGGVHV